MLVRLSLASIAAALCVLCCPGARSLAAPSQAPVLTFQFGHSNVVNAVAFSPDGSVAISGAGDRDLILWHVATRRRLNTLGGHTASVTAVAFSPDGSRALSGSDDASVRLWDLATGQTLRVFTGHAAAVTAASFSPDGRTVLAGSGDAVRLWDAETGAEVRAFSGLQDGVYSAAFSPDARFVLSGGGYTVRLLDAGTGREIWAVREGAPVRTVAYSPDGRFVLSGGGFSQVSPDTKIDNEVKLRDAKTGALVRTFKGHSRVLGGTDFGYVNAVTFSPDGRLAASGSEDATIRLWDVGAAKDSGGEVRVLRGPYNAVNAVAFSSDGRYLISGDKDKTVRLWDVGTGNHLGDFGGRVNPVRFEAVAPDGQSLVMGGEDQILKVWDFGAGREVRRFPGSGWFSRTIAMSADGRQILVPGSGQDSFTLKLFDPATGREIRKFAGHAGPVHSVVFSPDGRYALTGSHDTTLKLWDLATGLAVKTLTGHPQPLDAVAFSPDGRFIASASLGTGPAGVLLLWEASTGRVVRDFKGTLRGVHTLAFSPDGRYLASGGWEKSLTLWDTTTGAEAVSFPEAADEILKLVFSPNGRFILTGGKDRTATLWDAATGRRVESLVGHRNWVDAVAFLPNGRHVVTTSYDGTSKVWELGAGGRGSRELCTLVSFDNGHWAVVAPDGRFDTDALDGGLEMHWIVPDAPFTALPLEIFMREYYEPRLLPRLLAGERLAPIRSLADLNRVQPKVRIVRIEPVTPLQGPPDEVSVTVEVAGASETVRRGDSMATIRTGVQDLRLFRNGQLVGASPAAGGPVALDPATGAATVTFPRVRLPRSSPGGTAEFSAYAFNDDRVKSLTDRKTFALPAGAPVAKGRAYLIVVGANAYEDSELDLRFAANDARRIGGALADRLRRLGTYDEVVAIPLISDYKESGQTHVATERMATKRNIQAVLDLLSGRSVDPAVRAAIPGADRIRPARPEDFVLLSFSGHGYADAGGTFYIVPYDVGVGGAVAVRAGAAGRRLEHGGAGADLLDRCVSSEELSLWLREVDAGDLVMIVDACQSAASVATEGFKPGPMGSRGLGQLAYDKGMRILAATQADNVALESRQLQQGLLTYALILDGIEAWQADFKPKDGALSLSEWLAYAVDRVPSLYREIKAGAVSTFGAERPRILVHQPSGPQNRILRHGEPPRVVQHPALFDFSRTRRDVALGAR